MPVADWAVKAAAGYGLDIAGFDHAIDGSAIRHMIKNHGNAKTEANRGQVAVTREDFLLIPEIISNPDKTVYGAINDRGQDVIGYIKQMPDGTTVYLEEVRTGRKTLTAHTMWKYPPGHHATSIEKSLQHTARTEPGGEISIVENPAGFNQPK
ncbi:MAG: hypothetical protein NC323_03485 [Oxalobacter formigenes]|nr:hypothetical protein [Oxalobacter formigenes]